uniref:Uncharacterized protein n=1 Tax=Romanomermis culicivorax TaxID=13658 RepID=A0A915JUY6_ROMCU
MAPWKAFWVVERVAMEPMGQGEPYGILRGSSALLDGNIPTQVRPNSTLAPTPNLVAPPVLAQVSDTATTKDTRVPAISQVPPPTNPTHPEIDPNIDHTHSMESFVNLDLPLAPAATLAPTCDHCSSLTMANANVHNFQLQAHDALEQFNTTAARITNNVLTVQTIDQTIGAISHQFQAQQLCVQQEIQEKVQTTNVHFAALAEQMQQLFSTTTAAAVAHNNPLTARKPPATSHFHGEEPCDTFIPNNTFCETKPALAHGRPPA